MTPPELYALDRIGLPRFTTQQAKAIVDMVRDRGMLVCDPPPCSGTGIIIAAGGRYLAWGYINCRRLREMGCGLPIQVWHLGEHEMPKWASTMFQKLDVKTVDAHKVLAKYPMREMGPWPLKAYGIRHCPWERVMFLDADSFPQVLPEEVLNDQDVRKHGSLFFNDVGKHNHWTHYADCSLLPLANEWEAGQYIIHKTKGWMGLQWQLFFNEHTDVFYQTGHGDKATLETAFRMSGVPFMMGGPSHWAGWGIEHQFKGRFAFGHVMAAKRGEAPLPFNLQPYFDEWKSNTLGKLAA